MIPRRRSANVVAHQISLTGIGGVQSSFGPYLRRAQTESAYRHEVYGLYDVDPQYAGSTGYVNMKRRPLGLLRFLFRLMSASSIVHFYNNQGSAAVRKLLQFAPSSRVIFHERGTAWNVPSTRADIYKDNAAKAAVTLANSNASKALLQQKIGLPEETIRVVHNGVVDERNLPQASVDPGNDVFTVGFMGRLDTPKGVHAVIETARLLRDKAVVFHVAGDGPLAGALRERATGLDNILFVGRVDDPHAFLAGLDCCMAPSIREPLGNAVIEAGLAGKAVIASEVDGIPEIIESGQTGILLRPTKPLERFDLPAGAAPYPEAVIDSGTGLLTEPKEIDPNEAAEAIVRLAADRDLRMSMGEALRLTVTERFTLGRYLRELDAVYAEVLST